MADESSIDSTTPSNTVTQSLTQRVHDIHFPSSSSRGRRFSDADSTTRAAIPTQPSNTMDEQGPITRRPVPSETSRTVRRPGTLRPEDHAKLYPDLSPHVCDQAVCKVAEVFATTELRELILRSLSTDGILEARLIRSDFNSLIEESPHLRPHLFVKPCWRRPAEDFKPLSLAINGLNIRLGKPVHLGQWVEVRMTLAAALLILADATPTPTLRLRSRSIFEGIRRGLGPDSTNEDWPLQRQSTPAVSPVPTYDQLLVTQPPLTNMQVFKEPAAPEASDLDASSSLSPEDEDFPAALAKVSCDAGITLGFLAESTMPLLEKKPAGSNGESSRANDPNEAVLFKAILSFCQSDTAPRKRSDARTLTRIP